MEYELSRISKLKNIENWSVWKFQVRIVLNANAAWDVVTGESVQPAALAAGANDQTVREHAKNVAAWKKLDATAQRIIVTTIGEQPTLHIIHCETAKAMWDKLVSVYE
ncbi:unnamed protein product [Lasius platythorax]|uniref:Uncharacterized protein n=1 Tax=Lasius platythorax TaxID=488582 RepID=A0AAV2MYJ5_9HYME